MVLFLSQYSFVFLAEGDKEKKNKENQKLRRLNTRFFCSQLARTAHPR